MSISIKSILYFIWVILIKTPIKVVSRLIWDIYCLPGHILIWYNFFFPKEWGKKRNVATSGRAFRSKGVMAPIYSFFLWIFILMLVAPV
jgi:hypothetical protein